MQTLVGINKSLYNEQTALYIVHNICRLLIHSLADRDNKHTIDLNGPELPGRHVPVEFYEGGPAVMVSVTVCWLCVKCVTIVG